MARKKGKTTNISSLLFEDINPYAPAIGDMPSQAAGTYPLASILPDPYQPRQMLPEALTTSLFNGQLSPLEVMQQWVHIAEQGKDKKLTQSMADLRRLASSIEMHGLINPISIRPAEPMELPAGFEYVIVTGERRFWSYTLLAFERRTVQEGDTAWEPDHIKATLAPSGVLISAHQIIENLMREDINVLEKAQGLWALRYELSYDAYRRHSDGDDESDAYRRQHSYEYPEDMPLVAWRRVEESLDMSRQYRARIVGVLKLSEEAQAIVNEHNLAEATIRPLTEKLKDHPHLQLQALHQLLLWQEEERTGGGTGRRIVPSVRSLVEELLAQTQAAPTLKQSRSNLPSTGKLRQKLRDTARYIDRLNNHNQALNELTNQAELIQDLTILQEQISNLLAKVEN